MQLSKVHGVSPRFAPLTTLVATLVTAPLIALIGCASEPDPHASLRAVWFPAALSGHVTITKGGVPGSGSRIDVDRDLDLDGASQGAIGVDAELHGLRLGVDFLPLGFDGSNTLGHDVVFHGATYASGHAVESQLDLDTWAVRLDGPVLAKEGFELRVGGGAYLWHFDMELDDRTSGSSDSRAFSRLLPAITASTRIDLTHSFQLGLDGAFAAIGGGRRLSDAATTLSYAFEPRFLVTLGFRWLRYELNEDTNVGTLDLFGPTLGLTVRF